MVGFSTSHGQLNRIYIYIEERFLKVTVTVTWLQCGFGFFFWLTFLLAAVRAWIAPSEWNFVKGSLLVDLALPVLRKAAFVD